MPSDKPVKSFIERISSLLPDKLPSPPKMPTEGKQTLLTDGTYVKAGKPKEAVKVELKNSKQAYLLIQSIRRTNPSAASRLKMEMAKEILTIASKSDVFLTLSAACDIVEQEYQRAIGKDLTVNLQYARARFREANEILHPVMSRGFRVGVDPEDK